MSESKRPTLLLNKGGVSSVQESVKRLSLNAGETSAVASGPSIPQLSKDKGKGKPLSLSVAAAEEESKSKKPELSIPNCPPARLQLQKLQAAGMPRPLFS